MAEVLRTEEIVLENVLVKLFGGQKVNCGGIIVRQRGTKFYPGKNVGLGRDHTIYALKDGLVEFVKKGKSKVYINVS